MAKTNSQAFRGGNISPGQGIHEDMIHTLYLKRQAPIRGNNDIGIGSYTPLVGATLTIPNDSTHKVFNLDWSDVLVQEVTEAIDNSYVPVLHDGDSEISYSHSDSDGYHFIRVYIDNGNIVEDDYVIGSGGNNKNTVQHKIDLPEPSWGVFKSASLQTDTTAQNLQLSLEAYSGDSVSLENNAVKLGVGDYLVCGTVEVQGPASPSPDYEQLTFEIFNSQSSYDVDCSTTAKKIIPFCTIIHNVTHNYSDTFGVQCTKSGVNIVLTSLTVTAIATASSEGGSGLNTVTHDSTMTGAGTLMSPLGVNTASTINPSYPSPSKFPTETAVINFVNNAVSTYSAMFLGTLSLTNDLNLPYPSSNPVIAAALNGYQFQDTPSINDFCFVEIDDPLTTGPDEYRRFSFDGSVWKYQYTINNTTFTTAQWDAINSGIDSQKVNDYDNHLLNQSNPHGVTKSQVGLGNVTNDAQVKRTEMGAADGVATLDNTTKIPLAQIPIAIDPNNGDTSKFLNERGNFTNIPVKDSFDYEGAGSYPNSAPSVPAVVNYVQTSEFVITPESGKKFFAIAKLKKADIPERASLKLTLTPGATDADTGFAEPQSADIDITCVAQGVSTQYDKYDVTIRWYYPGTALYTWNSYPTDGMKELYLIEDGNYIYVVLETAVDTLDLHTTKILCHTDNRAFVFLGTQGASIPSGTVKAGAVFQSYIDNLFMHKAPQKLVYVPANTDFGNFITSSYSDSFSKLVFGNDGLPSNTAFCADVELVFLDLTCDAYIKMGNIGQSVTCHISFDGTYGFVMFFGDSSKLVIMQIDASGNLSILPNNNGYAPMYMPSTNSVTSGDTTHVPTADAVYQGLSSKADKVSGSVGGLLASLDANGNLASSGITAREVYETVNAIGGKQDVLPTSGAAEETYAINITGTAGIHSFHFQNNTGYFKLADITFDNADFAYAGVQIATQWRNNGNMTGSGIITISFGEYANGDYGSGINGRVFVTFCRGDASSFSNPGYIFYVKKISNGSYTLYVRVNSYRVISFALMSGNCTEFSVPDTVTTISYSLSDIMLKYFVPSGTTYTPNWP